MRDADLDELSPAGKARMAEFIGAVRLYAIRVSNKELAERLDLLPVGVEVLLVGAWDYNQAMWVADKLGLSVEFEVSIGPTSPKFCLL